MASSRLGLVLNLYTAPSSSTPLYVAKYADAIDSLNFSTNSNGGYGDLTCRLKLRDVRQPRSEFQLLSRVALSDGSSTPLFLGELTDPQLHIDTTAEYLDITALGIGLCLKDDPLSVTYINQTGQQIVIDQLTGHGRANYNMPVDQDTSAILTDNPAATYSPVYPNASIQDVLNSVTLLETGGGTPYDWFAYAHPTKKDAAGFPVGQLVVRKRDTTTIHYQASFMAREVVGSRVIPSSERAYNVVALDINDPAAGGLQTVTYTDPRLTPSGGQGTAPFRRRKFSRSLVGISTITVAQAQLLANAYGAQFKNATNKVELQLKAARDGNGVPIPLQQIQAGKNIFVPELAVRGQALTTTPTPGVNLFYIVSARYSGSANGDQMYTLQCDNYVDSINAQVARLQLAADAAARAAQTTTGAVQALGAPMKGSFGIYYDNNNAGNNINNHIQFPAVAAVTPTSIVLNVGGSSNTTTPTAGNISNYGFDVLAQCQHIAGSNTGYTFGTWTSVGNTLLDPDLAAGTYGHHCDGCDATRLGLLITDEQIAGRLIVNGHGGLAVVCPACGTSETFNTRLGSEHERHPSHAHHARQARRIRALMAHPAIGLVPMP